MVDFDCLGCRRLCRIAVVIHGVMICRYPARTAGKVPPAGAPPPLPNAQSESLCALVGARRWAGCPRALVKRPASSVQRHVERPGFPPRRRVVRARPRRAARRALEPRRTASERRGHAAEAALHPAMRLPCAAGSRIVCTWVGRLEAAGQGGGRLGAGPLVHAREGSHGAHGSMQACCCHAAATPSVAPAGLPQRPARQPRTSNHPWPPHTSTLTRPRR